MALSLRRRLVTVSLLAAVAFVGAVLAFAVLARTSTQQRRLQAEERVTREAERIRDAAELGGGLRVRRMPSGLLDESLRDAQGYGPPGLQGPMGPGGLAVRALRQEAALECARTRALTLRWAEARRGLRRRDDGNAQLVVAVVPVERGGYAWASSWVISPRAEAVWRLGVLALALATLAMVVVALHTLAALNRGARQLGDGLRALSRDLGATVERPSVAELAQVSDGIASLARDLLRAQDEHVRLSRELAVRDRLASLGRVAAGVAHEVRNPMASIKLRVDLARQTVLAPRADLGGVAADLAEVADEIARLDRLVADLLIVSGRRVGPKRDADLRALVEQRAALLEASARERSVTFETAGSGRATVDVDGVVRAVDNLLRNAVEASPEGGSVRVAVRPSGVGAPQGCVIAVEDRGAGVAPERVGELFEPFFTTKAEGTGLGLALSRAVAEAHGGTLTYRREGATTVFELRLP